MPLTIGDHLPEFTSVDQNGVPVLSTQFLGKRLVIFFYPKDDTYLCTKEACSFRDANEDFLKRGIQVVGISADSVESHDAFAKKHSLKYTLLSDEQNHIRSLFGVPKGMLGLLPGRVTYCFDEHGIILSIINSSLSADLHVNEAIKAFINT
ncbi:MAG: peroxiredoxin [bacterium]